MSHGWGMVPGIVVRIVPIGQGTLLGEHERLVLPLGLALSQEIGEIEHFLRGGCGQSFDRRVNTLGDSHHGFPRSTRANGAASVVRVAARGR